MEVSLGFFPVLVMNFADAIIAIRRIDAFYSLSEVSHDVIDQ
mgnify:CR=1 FL=1